MSQREPSASTVSRENVRLVTGVVIVKTAAETTYVPADEDDALPQSR